jgi:hypothetical protein
MLGSISKSALSVVKATVPLVEALEVADVRKAIREQDLGHAAGFWTPDLDLLLKRAVVAVEGPDGAMFVSVEGLEEEGFSSRGQHLLGQLRLASCGPCCETGMPDSV